MPDQQPIALEDQADRYDGRTRDLLYLLTKPEDPQPLWSVQDLEREIEAEAMPHVHELLDAGLAYRTSDGFVFASAAGYKAVQLIGQVI